MTDFHYLQLAKFLSLSPRLIFQSACPFQAHLVMIKYIDVACG